MMRKKESRMLLILNLALGALAFVVLIDGVWFWIGFSSAAAALVLARVRRKKQWESSQCGMIISVILPVCAAVSYLIWMMAQGYSMPSIL